MGIIIRQSIKGTVVTYIGAFIGIITTFFIATSLLSEEEIGLTRTLFEAATLLALLIQLGITSSAIRFFPYFKSKDGRHNGFFFYMIMIPVLGSIIFLPFFYLFKNEIADYFSRNSQIFVNYIDWVVPLALLLVYLGIFETYSNLLMRIAIPKAIREIVIRVLIVVVYVLYGFGYINLTEFVTGYVLVYGIAMLLNFWYVSRIGSVSLKHDYKFVSPGLFREISKYTAYLVAGVLGGGITLALDLFMIGGKMGMDKAGIYTIAIGMVSMIELPARSITAISTPVVSQAMQCGDIQKADELYKKVALNQLLIAGILFVLLWINLDNIFDIMPNGDNYREGKWSVFFLGITRLIIVFLSFGGTILSFSRYYYWTLFFSVIITIFSILTNNWLIPVYGMTGAAIATCLTNIVVNLVIQLLVHIKIKTTPFTFKVLKTVILIAVLFFLNTLLPEISNPWLDGIYRTAIIGLTGMAGIYFLKISQEINHTIKELLKRALSKSYKP